MNPTSLAGIFAVFGLLAYRWTMGRWPLRPLDKIELGFLVFFDDLDDSIGAIRRKQREAECNATRTVQLPIGLTYEVPAESRWEDQLNPDDAERAIPTMPNEHRPTPNAGCAKLASLRPGTCAMPSVRYERPGLIMRVAYETCKMPKLRRRNGRVERRGTCWPDDVRPDDQRTD